MKNLLTLIQDHFKKRIAHLFPEIEPIADVTQSRHPQFGHYQCNAAMKIAKQLKQNPREIAKQIVDRWTHGPMVEKLEVAGPGFINLTLSTEFLSEELQAVAQDSRLGAFDLEEKKKVIVEFSSPNVAKELHVGHLRSTIIGESLARLFEFLGYEVLRLNHIGDWGTQFGMLITYLKEHHRGVLSGEEEATLSSLMEWYRASKKGFDSNPDFKKRAQLQVVSLQRGEQEALKAWEKICAISRKGFSEIYSFLDVSLQERGESFYNPMLGKIIEEYENQGIVTLSEGAKCVFLEGHDIPMILQKSDGGFNYSTTDAAALAHRIRVEKADRILYVVDAGQQLHFQMLFKASEKAGILDPQKTQVEHVPFGVVLGVDGKKFKTRSGETEKLIDLLKEAVRRAQELLRSRNPDLDEEELSALAHVLGVDAVKYADLSCHRLKDYVFSYDKMLNFEGNTAAYLLYSFVRIQGIKRKCQKDVEALFQKGAIQLSHPAEISLGLKLRQFGEALAQMELELLPNRLTDYLYELAETFHLFFQECRVIGSQEEEARLALSELTGRILQKGLFILGLKTIPRM